MSGNYAGYYGSLQEAGYMFVDEQSSYNVTACASRCDATAYCKGFSIYYERDPTLQPADACPNPSPLTSIRCTYYTQAVGASYTTNIGEWRDSFAVVIAGANGYTKN